MEKLSIRSTLLIAAVLSLIACGGGSSNTSTSEPTPQPPTVNPEPDNTSPSKEQEIDTLWQQTIRPYLEDELWIPDYNYDAAHALMVPMHWAFKVSDSEDYQAQFDTFFTAYEEVLLANLDSNYQRRLQFFYLTTQYLTLQSSDWTSVHQSLFDLIQADIEVLWSQIEIGGFTGGIGERVQWKLDNISVSPEYSRAIFDNELHLLAVAADLSAIANERSLEAAAILNQITEVGTRLFEQEGSFTSDGGWLFQPGVWSDYSDYVYAGNAELAADLEEMVIDDIATDSSHFHRMPLWLNSYKNMHEAGDAARANFEEMLSGLLHQFNTYILVPSDDEFPAPRMNNYSDGRNGVYRYNFNTLGAGEGYGPYQLSGVLMHSWYAFLGSELLKQEVQDLAFPLSEQILDTYSGPGTSRVRHPLISRPEYYNNGFAELYSLLTSEL